MLLVPLIWSHFNFHLSDAEKAKMIGNPVDNLGTAGHVEECYGHEKLHNVPPVQPEQEQSDMAIK